MPKELNAILSDRCVIIGNSGSGKSTLASEISKVTKAEILDLDTVAWENSSPPRLRPTDDAMVDIRKFIRRRRSWIVEGCYGDLAEALLVEEPTLIFLDPGLSACQENCKKRPWEPHKFKSVEEQNSHLEFLLNWVAEYYRREDSLSHHFHLKLFERYTGPKHHITSLSEFSID